MGCGVCAADPDPPQLPRHTQVPKMVLLRSASQILPTKRSPNWGSEILWHYNGILALLSGTAVQFVKTVQSAGSACHWHVD